MNSYRKPRITITDLSKSFNDLEVLHNITITVAHGQVVSIIGPSGCGKSTLFNIIAGLEEPSSGNIMYEDTKNSKRLGAFGYMLQQPLLLPWKTIEENVCLGLLIKGVPKAQAVTKARNLLTRFSLNKFAKNYPGILSGGMAQRIAILRTVLYNHSFLLMDEPFGALDALTRLEMQMWFLEILKEYHSSVLLITHDIAEAVLISDKIYVLAKRPGKVIRTFTNTLPYPRKRKMLSSKKALSLVSTLEQLLLKENSDEN